MPDPSNLKSSLPNALVIGNDIFFQAIFAGDKPFVFKRKQMEFLFSLQKMKNIDAAAIGVGETTEWAKRFLASPKFRMFRDAKLQEGSIQNGLTMAWWNQWGKWCADGYREAYVGTCDTCRRDYEFTPYQVELNTDDDLAVSMQCPVCYAPIAVKLDVQPFKPTREQVQAWQELGSRINPKVERIHKSISNEEFIFEGNE